MNQDRVSVIIPAYKAVATIGRAVESVLAQTHPAAEIIVIDDGSPDDVATVLAAFGDRVTLIRQANGGAASARNAGIDRATGDLIAFLDADDYWEPQKLARHVELYRRHPELGLTCSRHYSESPGGNRQPNSPPAVLALDQPRRYAGSVAFAVGTDVWTGTVVVPRSILGGERFVSGLEPAEDRHLWVRLICAAPVYCISEPLATAVLVPGSLSRSSVDRDCSNMLKVVDMNRDLLGPAAWRMWKSHTYYRWAACHSDPGRALLLVLRALWLWPWPFSRKKVDTRFARGKVAGMSLLRLFRVTAR